MAQFRKDTSSFLPNSTTLFETVMIADRFGNIVGTNPSGTAIDAFGRLRAAMPYTLFDSSHRYQDNLYWNTSTATGGTSEHNANQGLMDLSVTTASGSSVLRETTRVFCYQPGKSLLVLNTFVMAPAKTNLVQRIGYFGTQNGLFIELSGNTLSFVKRSLVTGSVIDTKVQQSEWNIDTLDGTGPSKLTLDITKAQIMWMDIEWLGVGSVRMGFVINGEFIHCHTFHHSNIIDSTYITTASLPLRYEIYNTGVTSSASTLKQICSTVISEGGFQLRGVPSSIGIDTVDTSYILATKNTYYPIISIRLKSDRMDSIVLPSNFSIIGTTASDFRYKIITGATITGGTWTSAGSTSPVEYNITSTTAITDGALLKSGYFVSQNGISPTIALNDTNSFRYQLERNTFTNTSITLTIAIAAAQNNDSVLASIDWEEIVR